MSDTATPLPLDGSEETWRDVDGYVGLYQVSDMGRVRSLMGRGKAGLYPRLTPKILAQGTGRYAQVTLCRDGHKRAKSVHDLVLTAFVGPRPSGCEAAHNDGKSRHNWASNLSWKTHRDNVADKIAHGTHQIGERNPCARLTQSCVAAIRRDYRKRSRATGAPALGRHYGVAPSTILAVIHGVNWSQISTTA